MPSPLPSPRRERESRPRHGESNLHSSLSPSQARCSLSLGERVRVRALLSYASREPFGSRRRQEAESYASITCNTPHTTKRWRLGPPTHLVGYQGMDPRAASSPRRLPGDAEMRGKAPFDVRASDFGFYPDGHGCKSCFPAPTTYGVWRDSSMRRRKKRNGISWAGWRW